MEYDLIICLYGCDTIQKYKHQIYKLNEVYNDVLREYPNIKIIFFLGEEKTDVHGDNYINLHGVKNDYLSASYKQFLGLKYIYENFKTKFVIVCGTDTYLNIPKLNNFIKNYDPNDNLYIGGHGDNRNLVTTSVFFHSGGPGFILSCSCLTKIYPKLHNFMNEWILICKKNNIEYLISACDVGIAYLVNLKEISAKTIDVGELVFTHCNFRGYPCHAGKINYETLVSCHNMSLSDFDEFTQILKKNNYFVK